MLSFKDRCILVTGASQGLGYEVTKHFSSCGAAVVLLGRQKDKLTALSRELPERNIVLEGDLCAPDSICSELEGLLYQWPIDCVLHAAGGGLGLREPLITTADLNMLFQINLSGAVAINNLLVPHFKAQGRGNIVHVGSVASQEAVGSVGYNTVKAALAGYVRSLGRELAGSGVIVTGLLPGGFSAKDNAMERLKANKPEIYADFVKNRLPRKQMGVIGELMPLIDFLCSSAAGMMCGCLVPIDGGEGRGYSLEAL